jgi:glyoxylase-like metal-dependent hydrolase (beta-lactamase superfamily II)
VTGLTVHPLHVGTLRGFPTPAITYHRGWGERLDVPMVMFVILGGEHPVVVDTGTGTPEFTRAHHGYDLDRPADQEPLAALKQLGVAPEDVGTVVHTHLHWDHCSNDDLFPAAEIIVQKAELGYAVDPLEPNRKAFQRGPGVLPPWVTVLDRIRTVDGDAGLMPGISVVALPGHTPGSQGVLVAGAGGSVLVAGDCVDTYANWEGDGNLSHIPSGSFTDLAAYMDSFRRIEQLGCEVIPSHDTAVLDKGVFGR